MAEVARLYYVRDLTQQQIAERLGVSRFKVLRLLEQARAERVVRFEIDEPAAVDDELSRALEERYGLSTALVVDDIAAAAATLLTRVVRSRDVLGVAWGETLASIERRLAPPGPGAPVVQVCGAIEGLVPGTGPTELAARYAAWSGGAFHPLEAPAVADEAALRRAVSRTTAIFDRVSVTLVGIGPRDDGGHILVHVFDRDGRIVSAEESIALSVAQLRRTRVVAAAGGRRKRRAVVGALRSGLLDILVTDATCAKAALV
jgi:DNA-binding transcriptional regulator LsrR (DeoR family)